MAILDERRRQLSLVRWTAPELAANLEPMNDFDPWARRALQAVRLGSAWERYDFNIGEGDSIRAVVEVFGTVTRSLGLDCVEACAMLYVPVLQEDSHPALADLDPWRGNLVPQVYICSPNTVAAWLHRAETWTAPMRDAALSDGLTMRGLSVHEDGAAPADTYRHLVVRREASSPLRFDTLD